MSWLRLDDGFADHPKLLELTRADRWRWAELLGLCARYRTRGAITPGMLRAADIAPRLLERLLELRLFEPGAGCTCENPDECADGLHVHDWPIYNPVRDRTNRDRQARWRARHRPKSVQKPDTARVQKPDTATPQPPGKEDERNALRDALPVTPGALPPVPVPLTTPPVAPLPPAAGGARRIDSGRIDGAVTDELERLRKVAGDAPSWPDEPAQDGA